MARPSRRRRAPASPEATLRADREGVAPLLLPSRGPVELAEDPHAHIVCRACGRIQPIELSELERHFLTELAERRPEGWSVNGIAFSLMGACQRCREGPAAGR
jgi:hypothetical protein